MLKINNFFEKTGVFWKSMEKNLGDPSRIDYILPQTCFTMKNKNMKLWVIM